VVSDRRYVRVVNPDQISIQASAVERIDGIDRQLVGTGGHAAAHLASEAFDNSIPPCGKPHRGK